MVTKEAIFIKKTCIGLVDIGIRYLAYYCYMKRRPRVSCEWSENLGYIVGLFASDGSLSKDGRHLNFTSKDLDLVETIRALMSLKNKIGKKSRGGSKEKKYYQLQFGDIHFYEFLVSIGLRKKKSLTLGPLLIPDIYFRDFLRGCIDGDGSIDSFQHPESSSPQIRVRLCSASPRFLPWMLLSIRKTLGISGGWIVKNRHMYVLCFGKSDSLLLLSQIYYKEGLPSLRRKRKVAMQFLRASGGTGIRARFRPVSRKR